MLRIAIVEDDQEYIDELCAFLCRYQTEHNFPLQISCFRDGEEFLSAYAANQDIILMDIEMPHMDGMRTAERLRQQDSSVCLIFVTNMAQFAVKGYEVDAMDFLVKPVSYPVFSFKLNKAIAYVNKRTGDGIVLKTRNGIVRLPAATIHFAEVVRHNVLFHTDNGIFESRSSLRQVESQLRPFGFSRCNACYLVNLRYVSKVEDYTLHLATEKLEISRGKKAQFMQDLMHFLEV